MEVTFANHRLKISVCFVATSYGLTYYSFRGLLITPANRRQTDTLLGITVCALKFWENFAINLALICVDTKVCD